MYQWGNPFVIIVRFIPKESVTKKVLKYNHMSTCTCCHEIKLLVSDNKTTCLFII